MQMCMSFTLLKSLTQICVRLGLRKHPKATPNLSEFAHHNHIGSKPQNVKTISKSYPIGESLYGCVYL